VIGKFLPTVFLTGKILHGPSTVENRLESKNVTNRSCYRYWVIFFFFFYKLVMDPHITFFSFYFSGNKEVACRWVSDSQSEAAFALALHIFDDDDMSLTICISNPPFEMSIFRRFSAALIEVSVQKAISTGLSSFSLRTTTSWISLSLLTLG